DGDYPRQRQPLDFDLMGRDYRPGDRSRREDDRYLFLEALLSARERLHLSWVGRGITDNSPRPPSVLVGQLRDHLNAGWRLAGHEGTVGLDADPQVATALVDALTLVHPLQPFSPRYFPADPADSPWFTYAREWRPALGIGASPLAAEPVGALEPPLPPLVREEPLTRRDLADFLKAPVRAFFRQRLKVDFDLEDPAGEDQEPFALDPLRRWQLNDELLRAQALAVARDEAVEPVRTEQLARIQRRGELAPGAFGEALAAALVAPMDDLFERYRQALARWPRLIEEEAIQFTTAVSGQTLELADWLGAIRVDEAGQRGRVVLESSDLVKGQQYQGHKLIRHWVDHIAGHLGGKPLTTVILSKVGDVTLAPLDPEQAWGHLTTLMTAWHTGMCRPLPLAVKTAFEWLKGQKADAARKTYEGGYRQMGEVETDACLARVYPDFAALAARGEFADWAENLLRPLYAALHPSKDQPPRTDPTQPTGATA
nr:exodeoxyribonuclease V subunit gamma [Chromatiaceae bacterium]